MCENPITIYNKEKKEYIKVKCGKCILCRRKKCREWAIKLYHESQYHKKMCMITLTFKPKFLMRPIIKTLNKKITKWDKINCKKIIINKKYKTMINPSYITNVKKTGWLITLFLKKLRKEMDKKDKKFSFFAVGEHGTKNTHRAHWHILFFGIGIEDLNAINIGKSNKNKEIYFSKIIQDKWNYKKMNIGNHTISEVTNATIKYVANYTMKKMYKKENEKYPTTMRFSNQNKIGIKWARRYHKELRKGYLIDKDNIRYQIPEQYYKEMLRYNNQLSNKEKEITAMIIEEKKLDNIIKLKEKGILNDEENKKKAKRLEIKYKNYERDTI